MSERFTKLYELQKNLYSEGSPVIVSAGSLLKDTQTNNIIVQLKFHSVSATAILALKVGIAAFDIAGKEIDGIYEYQYLDLSIQNGQEFGSNKAVVMPDPVTRSFTIKSITVVLADGQIHSALMPLSLLPQPTAIHSVLSGAELIKQYKLKTNDSAAYVPQESHGLWQCHCGEWNGCSVCSRCKEQKFTSFAALDLSSLTAEMNARLAEEAQRKAEAEQIAEVERREKAKQLAAAEEQRKANAKKTKTLLAVTIPIITFVLAFALWIYPDIVQPSMKYNQAQELLSNGQYDEANAAFENLIGYKDASTMAKEALYQKATQYLSEKNYDEAIVLFDEMRGYSDSVTMLSEAKYQKAISLIEAGNIEDAMAVLLEISDYADSSELLKQLQYEYANALFEQGDFDKAKIYYEKVSGHEDSATMAMECVYQKADCLFAEGNYTEAIELFNTIVDYSDSKTKIETAYSLYYMEQGNSYYSEAKFYLAIENYQKSSEAAAVEMIAKAEDEIDFINNICGVYGLVEKVSWGQAHTIYPANTDSCTISFNYEKGLFVVDSHIYVDEHYFTYNFDKGSPYCFEHYYQSWNGKYRYTLENDRLLWYEDSDNYRYYEKE